MSYLARLETQQRQSRACALKGGGQEPVSTPDVADCSVAGQAVEQGLRDWFHLRRDSERAD